MKNSTRRTLVALAVVGAVAAVAFLAGRGRSLAPSPVYVPAPGLAPSPVYVVSAPAAPKPSLSPTINKKPTQATHSPAINKKPAINSVRPRSGIQSDAEASAFAVFWLEAREPPARFSAVAVLQGPQKVTKLPARINFDYWIVTCASGAVLRTVRVWRVGRAELVAPPMPRPS